MKTTFAIGAGCLVSTLAVALLPTMPTSAAPRPQHLSLDKHVPLALSLTQHAKGGGGSGIDLTGVCNTRTGTQIATPDGIGSWQGGGFDVAGAADFTCGNVPVSQRTISTVTAVSFYGDPGSTQFKVTFYNDSGGMPGSVRCAAQTVTGSPTGSSYPTDQVTVMTLNTPCVAKKQKQWVEVQAVSPNNPWYWETQQEVRARFQADWRDANGGFGTGCTPGYQDDFYMQDCLFGDQIGEDDFMFTLG